MKLAQSSNNPRSNEMKIKQYSRCGRVMILGCRLTVLMLSLSLGVLAQTEPAAVSRVNDKDAIRVNDKDAANDTRYRIGAGDVLQITVRKAPELSGNVRVDQRGMVRLPMIEGPVQAACKTESELATEIATLYLELKKNPIVEVFVMEFQSRPVAVIGSVNSPGQFRLQRQVRLLELLSFAGGPSARAGRIINIIHTGGPNLCESEPANSEKTARADELVLYKLNDTLKGNAEANPFVRPGDIVALPEADQVFIIGHVMAPQAIFLRDKTITISRAIAMAGGPARDASSSKIRVVRQAGDGVAKQEFFVNLKDILQMKTEDIALMPNDIVEVPGSTGKAILGALTGAIAPTLTQLPIRMIP